MWYTRQGNISKWINARQKLDVRLTERPSGGGKSRDGDLHVGASAIGVRVDDYGAANGGVALVRKYGDVLGADSVVLDDGSIVGGGKREGEEAQGQSEGSHGRQSKVRSKEGIQTRRSERELFLVNAAAEQTELRCAAGMRAADEVNKGERGSLELADAVNRVLNRKDG